VIVNATSVEEMKTGLLDNAAGLIAAPGDLNACLNSHGF
jgi:hypothetical protein